MRDTLDWMPAIGFAMLFGLIGVAASLTPTTSKAPQPAVSTPAIVSPHLSAAVLELNTVGYGASPMIRTPLRLSENSLADIQ